MIFGIVMDGSHSMARRISDTVEPIPEGLPVLTVVGAHQHRHDLILCPRCLVTLTIIVREEEEPILLVTVDPQAYSIAMADRKVDHAVSNFHRFLRGFRELCHCVFPVYIASEVMLPVESSYTYCRDPMVS